MSKVIEADLPRNPEAGSSWLSFIGRPSFKATRRILVVDNELYTTRLIKILLEKKGNYCVLPENDPARAHQTARDFRPRRDLARHSHAGDRRGRGSSTTRE